MNPSRLTTATLASGLVLAASSPWMLVSCATTESVDTSEEGPTPIPEAGPVDADAGDAQVDGGCDASDPTCVTKPLTCDEADFCPVPTGVSNAYALTTVWGSGENDVWASGSGGTVVHWDGSAWTLTPVGNAASPIYDTFQALWGSGPNDVWVASATNMIFHTSGFKDGTATWQHSSSVVAPFGDAPLYAAWGTSADDVRLAGAPWPTEIDNTNQAVKSPSESGLDWMSVTGVTTGPNSDFNFATVHGMWGPSADELWVLADGRPNTVQAGQIFHGARSDVDFTWKEFDSRADVVLRGIWGSAADDIWAVGDHGTIRHFGPGASSWEVVDCPVQENLHGVWGSGPSDVWAVGESGTILHWDGAAWTPSVAAFSLNQKKPHLYGVWGSAPDDIWVVGDAVVLRFTGGAK